MLQYEEDPYPFDDISRFFNYFEEESREQELDSGFAVHNTCKEFDLYINKPTQVIQLKNKTLISNNYEDLFLDSYKEYTRQNEK